jgi:hypothetical protein
MSWRRELLLLSRRAVESFLKLHIPFPLPSLFPSPNITLLRPDPLSAFR